MLLRLSNLSLVIFSISFSFASASFFCSKKSVSTPDWGSAVHEDASKVRDISSLNSITAMFKQAFRASCDKMVNEILVESELNDATLLSNSLLLVRNGYELRIEVLEKLCEQHSQSYHLSYEEVASRFERVLQIELLKLVPHIEGSFDEGEDQRRLREQEANRKI